MRDKFDRIGLRHCRQTKSMRPVSLGSASEVERRFRGSFRRAWLRLSVACVKTEWARAELEQTAISYKIHLCVRVRWKAAVKRDQKDS